MTPTSTSAIPLPRREPRPIDRPVSWCAHCGGQQVTTLADAAGVGVAVRCQECGHVLSPVALRGVAARAGEASPHRLAHQLRVLAGAGRRHLVPLPTMTEPV